MRGSQTIGRRERPRSWVEESDLDRVANEMSAILDYIDKLREVDVSGVSDLAEEDLVCLRDDATGACLPLDPIEENAPSMCHAHFAVPRVIGGE